MKKLTVAFMLVVVGDHVRILTDARATSRYTAAVELVGSRGADDTVVGRRAVAGLAERRALLARRAITEAAIRTLGSAGGCLLDSKALRSVVRALREIGATCDAVASTVSTLFAS